LSTIEPRVSTSQRLFRFFSQPVVVAAVVASVVSALIAGIVALSVSNIQQRWSQEDALAGRAATERARLATIVTRNMGLSDQLATAVVSNTGYIGDTAQFRSALSQYMADTPEVGSAVFTLDSTGELSKKLGDLDDILFDLTGKGLAKDDRTEKFLEHAELSYSIRIYIEGLRR